MKEKGKKEDVAHSPVVGLAVAAAYATMSMSLALLNKSLLSSYSFPCYFLLLGFQLFLSLIFCVVTRDLLGNPFDIDRVTWDQLKSAAPMAVMYVFNVTVGMVGLQLVNVPMFFAIRRLGPLFIMAFEWATLGKNPDLDVKVSVATIAAGAVIAGWDSMTSEVLGYGITMLNNVITAAMYVMQKQFSKSTGLSTFGVVLYNSVIALPITVAIALAVGEVPKLLAFPALHEPAFMASVLIASLMGLLLTYTSVLCTTYNSPLATSITGNIKDVFTTTVGWAMFGGFAATVKSVGGLVLSFVGAGMYSLASLRKSQAASAAAQVAAAEMEKRDPAPSMTILTSGASAGVVTRHRQLGGKGGAVGGGGGGDGDDLPLLGGSSDGDRASHRT